MSLGRNCVSLFNESLFNGFEIMSNYEIMKSRKNEKNVVMALTCFVVLTLALVFVFRYDFGIETNPISHKGQELIFAHRGIVNYYAENSEEGFDEALNLGFTAIEIDVTQSGDNHLIVFHDDDGKRLLGINKMISEMELDEIKKYNLIINDSVTDNTVLNLEEFFDLYGDTDYIYLDIKVANKQTVDSLVYLFEKYDLYENTFVADENFLFLSQIKIRQQRIKTVLEGYSSSKAFIYHIIPVSLLPDYFAGFISNADADLIEFLQSNDLLDRYIAYGVDSSNIEEVNQLGISNIIVDYCHEFGLENSIEKFTKNYRLSISVD